MNVVCPGLSPLLQSSSAVDPRVSLPYVAAVLRFKSSLIAQSSERLLATRRARRRNQFLIDAPGSTTVTVDLKTLAGCWRHNSSYTVWIHLIVKQRRIHLTMKLLSSFQILISRNDVFDWAVNRLCGFIFSHAEVLGSCCSHLHQHYLKCVYLCYCCPQRKKYCQHYTRFEFSIATRLPLISIPLSLWWGCDL